jgi:hypothetical protein
MFHHPQLHTKRMQHRPVSQLFNTPVPHCRYRLATPHELYAEVYTSAAQKLDLALRVLRLMQDDPSTGEAGSSSTS